MCLLKTPVLNWNCRVAALLPGEGNNARLLANSIDWKCGVSCLNSALLCFADHVQGPRLHDTRHQGHLQAAAPGLRQSEQGLRGGHAVRRAGHYALHGQDRGALGFYPSLFQQM